MGNLTQKRQIAILTAIVVLSTVMITSMATGSCFDQKADAWKFKFKKSKTNGGSGGNGGNGGNGCSGNTIVS
ncbi:hypothetical protein [Candidatus Nitrosocosmicus franklandus]|uniref:Uncharacterized protein n=1 Tax=Candidatus Nitrosocosmicus franklandianus TaxID=1798806 RepID=A0A484IG79_9ARCH|nr:hypothetical protein [Candidatus Nitrosocosmicus franklandus]VFJ15180.1 exported protein of unknown function [Candidatus Nitrosocosmicus franklandus]